MSPFAIIILAISTASVAFFLLVMMRLFSYNRKYRLPESRYTKLFRIITKEHVAIIYFAMLVAYLALIGYITFP